MLYGNHSVLEVRRMVRKICSILLLLLLGIVKMSRSEYANIIKTLNAKREIFPLLRHSALADPPPITVTCQLRWMDGALRGYIKSTLNEKDEEENEVRWS